MQIYLIRHGLTEANKHFRYAGRTDVPLCAEGIAAAEAVGGICEVKEVYVTPLIRTQQTARILFPEAEQRIIPELQEMDFGDFEDRNAQEMENDAAYRAWVDSDCLTPCPNGDSMDRFAERVCAGFTQCIEAHQEKGTPAVFVVHGGTIMSILQRFGRPALSFYDAHVRNCHGFSCVLSEGEGELPFTLTELTHFERLHLV